MSPRAPRASILEKLDFDLLTHAPTLWLTRAHLFIPVGLISAALFAVGSAWYGLSTDSLDYRSQIFWLGGGLSVALGIFYILSVNRYRSLFSYLWQSPSALERVYWAFVLRWLCLALVFVHIPLGVWAADAAFSTRIGDGQLIKELDDIIIGEAYVCEAAREKGGKNCEDLLLSNPFDFLPDEARYELTGKGLLFFDSAHIRAAFDRASALRSGDISRIDGDLTRVFSALRHQLSGGSASGGAALADEAAGARLRLLKMMRDEIRHYAVPYPIKFTYVFTPTEDVDDLFMIDRFAAQRMRDVGVGSLLQGAVAKGLLTTSQAFPNSRVLVISLLMAFCVAFSMSVPVRVEMAPILYFIPVVLLIGLPLAALGILNPLVKQASLAHHYATLLTVGALGVYGLSSLMLILRGSRFPWLNVTAFLLFDIFPGLMALSFYVLDFTHPLGEFHAHHLLQGLAVGYLLVLTLFLARLPRLVARCIEVLAHPRVGEALSLRGNLLSTGVRPGQ